MGQDRAVNIDGEVWRDGDYCLDLYGTPYHVRNCISANGENTVAFESPPGSGSLFWLESPRYEVLRPLRRVDGEDAYAVMGIRRSWDFYARHHN